LVSGRRVATRHTSSYDPRHHTTSHLKPLVACLRNRYSRGQPY
jgi:hypothetical protein